MVSKQLVFKHPLAEVFGYPVEDLSKEAKKHREEKLCPFHNGDQRCTKDKKNEPLGVCSMSHQKSTTIICPVRFREDWLICKDAAAFFFDKDASWTPLKEIRLKEKNGSSAGNIDLVLAKHDETGKILDFGAIEVQAVYVSGNIRRPFEKYMENPTSNAFMNWANESNYPRPDYLSSSRKRLIPQLAYKGRILKTWGKKQVVIIDKPFYRTLPFDTNTNPQNDDLCWLVYEQSRPSKKSQYKLKLHKKIIEGFEDSMERLATPEVGDVEKFISSLEKKLKSQMLELKKEHGVWSFSQFLEKQRDSAAVNRRATDTNFSAESSI